MQISSKFTIAVHSLLLMYYFNGEYKITSEFIAESVNVNPVIIRRVEQDLKKANLIEVQSGSGGAKIIQDFNSFTLLDIYKAVCVEQDLFSKHSSPNLECPVGKNINKILGPKLLDAQAALEANLKQTTFADLIEKLNQENEL
jgi:DNA-binding IscR family transcriptional regulator